MKELRIKQVIAKELEETKAKLHSLQVEILDMSCAKENNSGFEPSLSVYQRSIDMVIAEARKTPPQSLADIRAEAVIKMFQSCKKELNHDHGQYTDCVVFEGDAIEYANLIKEE